MNPTSRNVPHGREQDRTYVSLTVLDGERRLKPTHVAFDRIHFAEPPRLSSTRVEIILVNGDVREHRIAEVLPHDADATRIPIRLMRNDQQE